MADLTDEELVRLEKWLAPSRDARPDSPTTLLMNRALSELRRRRSQMAQGAPVNLPFERVPQHAWDPGIGPMPPLPKVQPLFESAQPTRSEPLPAPPDKEKGG